MQSTDQQIIRMAREGRTIVQICEELQLDWPDVRRRLGAAGLTSWKGAKLIIGHRLNSIVREPNRARKEQLKADAIKWIDFLYQEGQGLSRKVDRAREVLGR